MFFELEKSYFGGAVLLFSSFFLSASLFAMISFNIFPVLFNIVG